jgi:hypothetical protein
VSIALAAGATLAAAVVLPYLLPYRASLLGVRAALSDRPVRRIPPGAAAGVRVVRLILTPVTRRLPAVLAAALVAGCATHGSPKPPDASGSDISEQSVRAHMEFLASDALNGRGSGTRDEWLAALYAAAQMRQWGLEPLGDQGGYVQTVEVERQEAAAPPSLSFPGGRYTHGGRVLVHTMSAARVAGPLQRLPAGGSPAAGAVVLMPAGASQADAAAAGRVAAIVLSAETPPVRERWTTLAGRLPGLPARLVDAPAAPARRAMAITLDSDAHAAIGSLADGTTISFEAELKPPARSQTWNAVGRITGSDAAAARELILLSAHLDHVGNQDPGAGARAGTDTINNGADDNASGTTAVLELARALSRGPRPRRTIVFALFGSEERGGFGSRYFAARPPAPLTQIVANLQFEMIGRPDAKVPPQTLWLTGYDRSNLGAELAKQGARLVADPHPDQNFFERSDNIQFARRGVVAHTISSYGLHPEYHTPADEIRLVDFAHMTRAIRSMLEPIRWLANSSFRPEWRPGMKP